jgi:NACalpha-BTF3-like transcription factor
MNRALSAAEEGRSFNELNSLRRELLLAERERARIKEGIKSAMRNRVVETVRKQSANNERRAATRRRRLNRINLPTIAENQENAAPAPDEDEIAHVMTRAGATRAEAIEFLDDLEKRSVKAANAEVTLQRLREVYNGRTAKNLRNMLRRRRQTRRRRHRVRNI